MITIVYVSFNNGYYFILLSVFINCKKLRKVVKRGLKYGFDNCYDFIVKDINS